MTDSTGKLVMESILETEAATILQFFAGLRGTLSVTFEEGTWSAWLYDLLNPHVDQLVVRNPRKNALLKDGNKSDRIDARKLAELLRGNQLKPVYHGETGVGQRCYIAAILAGASPARGTCPVATVAISGDETGDQFIGSPEVKTPVGRAAMLGRIRQGGEQLNRS